MDGKKVAIWVLSGFLFLALVGVTILFISNRKLKKDNSNPLDVLKKYIASLPTYANNQDALDAGLKAGDRYKTSATAEMFSTVTVTA